MTTTRPSATPRELGYRWPAEWEPHAATWLAWPHNLETWPGRLAEATVEFVGLAQTLARSEKVEVLCGTDFASRTAAKFLGAEPRITLWDIPTNDAWIRDFGPIFLKNDKAAALVDWRYNAWGNKYPPFDQDNAASLRIGRRLGMPRFQAPLVLEGGSIDGNGRGAVLTTRSCLLNPNRNAGVAAETIEAHLKNYLAAEEVIWLDGHLAGDDTDGHVDQLARFLDSHVVAMATESDSRDENFEALGVLRQQLQQVRVAGRPLDIIPLPVPTPMYRYGQRLPASYCNFYVANELVVVPQFGDSARDARACDILREHFPRRDVLGLACHELIGGLGAFHCLTQQQPV